MVWDWDDWNKIVSIIKPKETIYARKCEVKQLTQEECHQFFVDNHLQWDTMKNKNNIYIWLIYGWKLVEAISYGKPRYNKSYEWEVLRLCTSSHISVVGWASKIHKYFMDTVKPNSVMSYCDMSHFNGKVYEQLGFTLHKWNKPSRHWRYTWNDLPQSKQHFTDNQIFLRWFDQLVWAHFWTFWLWTSNDELFRQHGYVEIYDCWQATYIWNKPTEE